jgi:two-component system response regulator MprA
MQVNHARVLVVDDDEQIRDFLRRALSYSGFAVDAARTGEEGLGLALSRPYDVVVLDLMLPQMGGVEVCKRLRAGGDVPVLMLTAKDEVADRVEGLESGADDYLVKPFALEELVARLRVLIRRHGPADGERLRFADLEIDLGAREVRRGERLIRLTAREFDVLTTFMRHPRQVLSRGQILQQVWNYSPDVDTHVLEVYVAYLREKLEAGGEPRLIQTVWGVGYILKEPDR